MTIMKAVAQASDVERDLTPSEACVAANISKPTLYKHIRSGRVKAYKLGPLTRIDPVSLREAMRAEPLILAPLPTRTMSEETRAKLAASRKAVVAAQPSRSKAKKPAKAVPPRRASRKAERLSP